MQRLRKERGAVAVMVALLMVPLMGFAAVAVDVAAINADHQQLQIGADAGALAIAEACARGNHCTDTTEAQTWRQNTAEELAVANKNDGKASAQVVEKVTYQAGEVTVWTSGERDHWFAPVFEVIDPDGEFDHTTVRAKATAEWPRPGGGMAKLPLTFSLCELYEQTGQKIDPSTRRLDVPHTNVEMTIYLTGTGKSDSKCQGPSGNEVAGGFGWITPDSGTCVTTSTAGDTVHSSPGASVPNSKDCSPDYLASLVGRTVALPVFDQHSLDKGGANATYRIYGYAAFQLTGYYLGGQYDLNPGTCKGSDTCIRGRFVPYAELIDDFYSDPAAPGLGGATVRLIK
jgi:hypothetical protein